MKAKNYLILLLLLGISTGMQGQDWKQIRTGEATGVTILPGGTIVALVNGTTYRSTDAGQSWITAGLAPGNVTALRAHPNGSIYAGSFFGRDGLIYSTDGGVNWNSYTNISAWDVAFNSQGYIFAATEGLFVVRSVDNGLGWYGVQGEGSPMWSVAVDAEDNVYAGAQFGGIYRSTDNGMNWYFLPQDAPGVIDGLAIAPDGTIYMSGATGIGVPDGVKPMVGFYRSTDNAVSWEDISAVDSVQVGKNAVIAPSGTIYIGASYPRVANGVVLMSTDRGEHWQPLSEGREWGRITGIALDAEGGIYVAATTGVYMREGVSSAPEPGSPFSDNRHLSVITEPATLESFLCITGGENSRAGLQLIDMEGRTVRELELSERGAGDLRLKVSDFGLPGGIYLCRYIDGGHSETAKILAR